MRRVALIALMTPPLTVFMTLTIVSRPIMTVDASHGFPVREVCQWLVVA